MGALALIAAVFVICVIAITTLVYSDKDPTILITFVAPTLTSLAAFLKVDRIHSKLEDQSEDKNED